MTRRFIFLLLILTSACSGQQAELLPTLAVLPTLSPTPPPERPIQFWESVTGELLASDQADRWLFTAQAGDPVRLNALGNVQLTLYGPDGAQIASGTPVEATLSAAGTYTVEVSGPAGRYQLGLAYTDRPNPADYTVTPPPLTVGVPTPTAAFSDLGVFVQRAQRWRDRQAYVSGTAGSAAGLQLRGPGRDLPDRLDDAPLRHGGPAAEAV